MGAFTQLGNLLQGRSGSEFGQQAGHNKVETTDCFSAPGYERQKEWHSSCKGSCPNCLSYNVQMVKYLTGTPEEGIEIHPWHTNELVKIFSDARRKIISQLA